jgi:voltage-gated potassium channel
LSSTKKIYLSAVTFLVVIFMGTVGYMTLSDAKLVDAMYMTVITVASVGYEETVELDTKGRLFTMFLIIAGLSSWTLLTVNLVAFFVEGEFQKFFIYARIRGRIQKMKNHYIICGLGQVGGAALNEFMAAGSKVVAIEKEQKVIEEFTKKFPGLLIIDGDATDDDTLDAAGVERACGLLAAAESDAANLFIVLSARAKNSDMTISARSTKTENRDKLRIAGANHVVMPNVAGGLRMASTLLRPQVLDFLDVMTSTLDEVLRIEQAVISKESPLVGKTLMEAEIPNKTGLLVLAIKNESGTYTYNPQSTVKFLENDVLIVLGKADMIPKLELLISG